MFVSDYRLYVIHFLSIYNCCGLAPAGDKESPSCSVVPPTRWDGEENQKKKRQNSWVGIEKV